ncbi:MAG: Enolase [Parcubacteria group bacterium GW2011_GWB1_44_7]|nr:MAG: Enolase [Parcubacteria group bacterium GW2011_GWB1_44_7]
MAAIQKIQAREILDSRNQPTVEAEITLSDGSIGIASVPSGASTGKFEALELRDGDLTRYNGQGVLKAVANVNEKIAKIISGLELEQKDFDQLLIEEDGTENKGRLGASAILVSSMAFAKSSAANRSQKLWQYFAEISGTKKPALPTPMFNILNGGRHATDSTDIQEFMIAPAGENFAEKMITGEKIYRALKKILEEKKLPTTLGDEGGFAPSLPSNEAAIEIIMTAIESASAVDKVKIALDAAAGEFYKDGRYHLKKDGKNLSASELISFYENWLAKYPIISIEDPLAEDDLENWKIITEKLGRKIMLVGDDLFATNPKRLKLGIDRKLANAIIIKPNQIGTITETIETAKMAERADFKIIVSHRSGETMDTAIAHLAVGLAAPFIKAGAPAQPERLAKYDELLKIESESGT